MLARGPFLNHFPCPTAPFRAPVWPIPRTFTAPPLPPVFRPIPQPLYLQWITDILELAHHLARYLLYIFLVGFAHRTARGKVFCSLGVLPPACALCHATKWPAPTPGPLIAAHPFTHPTCQFCQFCYPDKTLIHFPLLSSQLLHSPALGRFPIPQQIGFVS